MFTETYRGYVGLGATEVFRTAQQAAADLDATGMVTTGMTKYGGLLNQQLAFKYAATQGRLRDVQQEVSNIGATIQQVRGQLDSVIQELEHMGVMGAGDYAEMVGKAALTYAFSEIMIPLQILGVDMFGSKKKKQKKIKALMDRASMIVKELRYWNERQDALQKEGEALSVAMDKGADAVSVQLVATPRTEESVTRPADPAIYGPNKVWRESKYTDLKTIKYGKEEFATQDELALRTANKMGATGDKLPVGFQTIYSPVLEHGKMVIKNPVGATMTPITTGGKVVYGGLVSGTPDDAATSIGMVGLISVGLYFFLSRR